SNGRWPKPGPPAPRRPANAGQLPSASEVAPSRLIAEAPPVRHCRGTRSGAGPRPGGQMHRHAVLALALALAGACTGGGKVAERPAQTTGPAPTEGPAVAVDGEEVRGAAVTVSGTGLVAHAGEEVGVLVTALDDDHS